MQWFKHDTNSTMDFKIKKLLIRYGAVGYAIYFHCLELIAESISEDNITFELEHDSEIIADDLRITGTADKSGKELVEEIMRYMIELNLFEESNGHIFCFKLLKRLDSSMTSNSRLRTLIAKAKESKPILENHDTVMMESCCRHDGVMMNHDSVMQDKTRLEETRREENTQEEKRQECDCVCADSFSENENQNETNVTGFDNYNWGDLQQELWSLLKDHNENSCHRKIILDSNSDISFYQKECRQLIENWRTENPYKIRMAFFNFLDVIDMDNKTWWKANTFNAFIKNYRRFDEDNFNATDFLENKGGKS